MPFGRFATFLINSTHHNVSFVKGRIENFVIKDSYYTGGTYQERGCIDISNYYSNTSNGLDEIHNKLVHVTNAGGVEWDGYDPDPTNNSPEIDNAGSGEIGYGSEDPIPSGQTEYPFDPGLPK